MINRIQPLGNPTDYKTYSVTAPLATHWRKATCAEVDCPHFLNGWTTTVDTSTDLGRRQAAYIEGADHGRRWAREAFASNAGPLVEYTFPPGQRCFRSDAHRLPLERDPIYSVRLGDWRLTGPAVTARAMQPADWLDDFANHQIGLAERRERG